MSGDPILLHRDGPVAILTLNRPERRNALSLLLMRALHAHLDNLAADRAVHAIILAAAGKVFSSGHDLAEMRGRDDSTYREIFDACSRMMAAIQAIPQPVIAEVQGLATAAGCQLAATCDLAVAADTASFATPGVRIGLFCSTPMVALTRAIGRKRAMEMLLTGSPISARTAAEWGLINRAVPAAELRHSTLALARQIAAASSLTVATGKQAFYTQIDFDQPRAYDYTSQVMSTGAGTADAQEGIAAFLDKRTPCWTGR